GICSVEGCGRQACTRGMCLTHHEAERGVQCSVPGCERYMRARGWCSTHHQRWRTTGTVADPGVAPDTCTFPECGRSYNAKGFCCQHRQQQRGGEALRPLGVGGKFPGSGCSILGCESPRAT